MQIAALLGLSLLWGSTFYLTKMLLPDFHPVSIVFYRCLFGSLALLPFFIWKKESSDFRNLPTLIFIALISAGIPWILMSKSMEGLDTTVSSVLNATGPIFGIVLSSIVFKVRVSKQEVTSVIIGFTGIIIAFLMGSSEANNFEWNSAMLLLFSVNMYALSAVLAGKYLQDCSVYTISFAAMVVGTIFSSFFMFAIDPKSYQNLFEANNFGLFIFLGIFNSGLGNILFYYLVKNGGAVFALLITYLMPFTTLFLGVFLLSEPLGSGTLLALFFVLGGLYLSKRGKSMTSFQKTVSNLMKNNFSLEKSSSVLIVTDQITEPLGRKFADAMKKDGWNNDIHVMEDRTKSGEEPPEETAELMLNYEIVFCLTKHSLTHTVARKTANSHGISVITMPGITEDMFLNGAMSADYRAVEEETVEVTQKLTEAKTIVVHTGNGLRLRVALTGRKGIPSTGVFKEKGASGNLPSGEAYIAPVEGDSEGVIEINGSIAGIGMVDEPIVLTIEQGRLIEASGTQGKQLLDLLGEGDGRILCELGIGTNHAARVIGNILEDEKAYNTIHVAFGSNHTFGGTIKTNVHIDCVTKNPEIEWLD